MFITIFFLSFIKINSEKWWPHVNGYDLNDVNDGFAGSSNVPAVDFYLCSERNYRVHYLGDDPMNWSKNFSNCDPVGIGRIIDGICLYGPKSYKGRLHHGVNWMGVIKGCNIDEKDGFAGKLGSPLACIAINGKELAPDVIVNFTNILLPYKDTQVKLMVDNYGMQKVLIATIGYGISYAISSLLYYILIIKSHFTNDIF